MLRVARPLQLESAAGAYLVLNRGNYRAGPHSPLVTAGREGSISSRASSDETVKAQQNCSRAISKNDKGATGWPPLPSSRSSREWAQPATHWVALRTTVTGATQNSGTNAALDGDTEATEVEDGLSDIARVRSSTATMLALDPFLNSKDSTKAMPVVAPTPEMTME